MPNCQCLNLQMIYLPSTHTQAKLNYRYVLQIRVEVELIDCSDNTHVTHSAIVVRRAILLQVGAINAEGPNGLLEPGANGKWVRRPKQYLYKL